jgi:hypothetical protein
MMRMPLSARVVPVLRVAVMNPLTTPGDMERTLDRLAASGATLARG